ncbi:hypothetical protein LTR41_011978 [Exophiala xenobiotica]|nr:hypothetical protein LTR41_011978 [Exophiala xenobiotica]KAK5550167.1 hypothetical protein LTR46_011835 [Exophiala xenobiotica]
MFGIGKGNSCYKDKPDKPIPRRAGVILTHFQQQLQPQRSKTVAFPPSSPPIRPTPTPYRATFDVAESTEGNTHQYEQDDGDIEERALDGSREIDSEKDSLNNAFIQEAHPNDADFTRSLAEPHIANVKTQGSELKLVLEWQLDNEHIRSVFHTDKMGLIVTNPPKDELWLKY